MPRNDSAESFCCQATYSSREPDVVCAIRAGHQMSFSPSPKEKQGPVGQDGALGEDNNYGFNCSCPPQPGYLMPRCDTFHVAVSVSITRFMTVSVSV